MSSKNARFFYARLDEHNGILKGNRKVPFFIVSYQKASIDN